MKTSSLFKISSILKGDKEKNLSLVYTEIKNYNLEGDNKDSKLIFKIDKLENNKSKFIYEEEQSLN